MMLDHCFGSYNEAVFPGRELGVANWLSLWFYEGEGLKGMKKVGQGPKIYPGRMSQ